jgi:hypothetical protein
MGTKCGAVKAKLETTPLCQMVSGMAEPWLALVGLNHGPPPVGSAALMNSANPAIKDSAAVQEANAIKQQEDAAPAKIEAIKYLAGVDCKCYPGVKKALLEALKDCNEGVRFEAAKALGSACCCDKEVAKILEEVANKQDDFGNYKEWSVRVRAAAAQSMSSCAGVIPRDVQKGVDPETPPQGEVPPQVDVPIRPQAIRVPTTREKQEPVAASKSEGLGWFRRDKKSETVEKAAVETQVPTSTRAVAAREETRSSTTVASAQLSAPQVLRGSVAQANSESKPASTQTAKPAVHIETIETKDDGDGAAEVAGVVTYVDVKTGSLRINFAEGDQPRAGCHVDVFHKYLLRTQHLGELEIMGTSDGVTLARPTGDLTIRQVSKGDRVVVRK